MADTDTLTRTEESTATDAPWNVILHDDSVNQFEYVVLILMKILGYDRKKATVLTRLVSDAGRAVVWSGEREKAEFYVQQLQVHQLRSTLEKAA